MTLRVHTGSNGAATIKLQLTVALKGFGARAIRSEFLYKNVQFLKYHAGPENTSIDHTPVILQLHKRHLLRGNSYL